jgi:hypothetical protein
MRLYLTKGDLVYVLGHGIGNVSKVSPEDGSFDVTIGDYGTLHFSSDGTMGASTIQRVYYQNPILVEPIKNENLWRVYTRMSQLLFNELLLLDVAGGIPPQGDSDA